MGFKSGFGGQPPYQPESGGKWQIVRDLIDKLPTDPKDAPKDRYNWGWIEIPQDKAYLAQIAASGYAKRRGVVEGWTIRTTVQENGVTNGFARLWLRRIER